MKAETYLTECENNTVYKFYSRGPKGSIELRIVFQKADDQGSTKLYNLAFGTWDADSQNINDAVELRNGDMDKILATVVHSALDFLDRNSDAYIFAQGSTPARTRKYQMGIAKFLNEIHPSLEILGLVANDTTELESHSQNWENFRVGTKYLAFLLSVR